MRRKFLLMITLLCLCMGLSGCVGYVHLNSKDSSTKTQIETKQETEPETEVSDLELRLLEETAPPDDEWDHLYASDYISSDVLKFIYARDSKAYDSFWDTARVTPEDILTVCQENDQISQEYKDFIYNYAKRWMELYPESDLRVLHHNLKTLKLTEASSSELSNITLTADAPACYVQKENTIYVKEGTDYSKGTPGYIILTHELTHAARGASFTDENGNEIKIKFYTEYDYGCYVEEALITLFAYEMQGMGDEGNRFYMLPYNYFRIMLDCIDYDGADYMNHNIHALADAMNAYMPDDNGMHMLLYFSSESMEHYESHIAVDYDEQDYARFHDYILRMYMKKHWNESMTTEESEALYQDFLARVMANFELASTEQSVTEANFRPAFERFMGISEETDLDEETPEQTEGSESQTAAADDKMAKKRADLEQLCTDLFLPADDEYDYKYAMDYEYFNLIKVIDTGDIKGYDQVFGKASVSLHDLKETLGKNNNISQTYKDFIYQYAVRWNQLYPGSDFRIFNQNLKTLKVIESTKDEIFRKTMASDAVACYLREQNEIYVRKGTDFSKGTSGYIVLTHELTHVLRSSNYENEDGIEIRIDYYPEYLFGTFTEEALITVLAYEMQGMGDKGNTFYLLPYNYLWVILDCIDYDGADYVNYNITQLAEAMDAFMEEEGNAIRMILFHEAEGNLYYCNYIDNPFTKADYEEFHEYITRMYMKKYLRAGMTSEEAEQIYETFISRILNNFDLVKSYQGVDEPELRIYFEKICGEMEISLE